MTPLILGTTHKELSDLDVAIINTCMIKTAMVLDYQKSRDSQKHRAPFFSPRQRTLFRDRLEAPAYTSIWLGRFLSSSLHSGRFSAKYHALGGKHFGNQRSYVLTFTVREVVLQLLTVRRTRPTRPILATACAPTLPWDLYLITTMPEFRGEHWPPFLHFDDETIKVFFDRWNQRTAVIEQRPKPPFGP